MQSAIYIIIQISYVIKAYLEKLPGKFELLWKLALNLSNVVYFVAAGAFLPRYSLSSWTVSVEV